MLWIGRRRDQAASFRTSVSVGPRSSITPSTNGTPARTRGSRWAPFSRRHRRCAISSSLKAISGWKALGHGGGVVGGGVWAGTSGGAGGTHAKHREARSLTQELWPRRGHRNGRTARILVDARRELIGRDVIAALGGQTDRVRDGVGLGRRELGGGQRAGDSACAPYLSPEDADTKRRAASRPPFVGRPPLAGPAWTAHVRAHRAREPWRLVARGVPAPGPRRRPVERRWATCRNVTGADGAYATALQPPPHLLTTLPAPAGGGRRVRPCQSADPRVQLGLGHQDRLGPPWTGRSVHGAVQASSRYSETWMFSQLPRCATDSARADRRLPASISRCGR